MDLSGFKFICEWQRTFNQEESDYAALWKGSSVTVSSFPLKERKKGNKSNPTWEPLDNLPPVPPPYQEQDLENDQRGIYPQIPPDPAPSAPPSSPTSSRTRSKVKMNQNKNAQEEIEERIILAPLREVPIGGNIGGIGFVAVPLNTNDVRSFKKEMGWLLDDPLGVSERLDQFLGPNIYTWEEMQSIWGILFTSEERSMIRQAGMRNWERRHQQGPPGEQKWPNQNPNWNNQNGHDRQNMTDLREIIIQGIREAVPRGQNINKAFSEHQEKDESPTDWLERLKKNDAITFWSGSGFSSRRSPFKNAVCGKILGRH